MMSMVLVIYDGRLSPLGATDFLPESRLGSEGFSDLPLLYRKGIPLQVYVMRLECRLKQYRYG